MMSDCLKFIAFRLAIIAAGAALLAITGCSAFQSLTEATREKSVALGSDTWGGGGEATVATPEAPVPSLSFWFGRRKAWYTSIKDKSTGQAAAEVVRASNTALDIKADATGIGASQSSEK